MGTRSLTYLLDEKDSTLALIYRQMDGYPDGMGRALYEILNGRHLVNGFSSDDLEAARQPCNGPGCMAATVIAGLKKEIGSIYLESPLSIKEIAKTTEDAGADYIYVIRPGKDKHTIMIQVFEDPNTRPLYDGAIDGMGDVFWPQEAPAEISQVAHAQ